MNEEDIKSDTNVYDCSKLLENEVSDSMDDNILLKNEEPISPQMTRQIDVESTLPKTSRQTLRKLPLIDYTKYF